MTIKEILPDPAPFFVFFLPTFWGAAIAYILEAISLEKKVASFFPEGTHPCALLGLAFFVLANTLSYLTGCVVCARRELGVKLPNLYASKQNKNATLFNCVQRGHQNFVESLPMCIASAFITALIADRPNVAGLMLLVVSACRLFYGLGYKKDIKSRFPPFLVSQFAGSVGVGYGLWMAVSALGVGPMTLAEVK